MADKKAEVVALTIYCPNKKRNVRIEASAIDWEHDDSECEMCGSHGYLRVDFKCKCGKQHNIEIRSW